MAAEHQLRLLDQLPDAARGVAAAARHRTLPAQRVQARDGVLVAESERTDEMKTQSQTAVLLIH